MPVWNNNDTIVTVREFFDNTEVLVQGTIERSGAKLIIINDEATENLIIFSRDELPKLLEVIRERGLVN